MPAGPAVPRRGLLVGALKGLPRLAGSSAPVADGSLAHSSHQNFELAHRYPAGRLPFVGAGTDVERAVSPVPLVQGEMVYEGAVFSEVRRLDAHETDPSSHRPHTTSGIAHEES